MIRLLTTTRTVIGRHSTPTDHARKSARFWTAPVLWRFDCARAVCDARNLVVTFTPLEPKAAEDCRSPRRSAPAEHARESVRFWTAPVLWRFHCARAVRDARDLVVSFTPLEPKAAEDCRSPGRSAPANHARKSARFWTAPVLWRFDCARAVLDARNLVVTFTPLEPKAAEDCRSPRRSAPADRARKSVRFWTAPVLWSFDCARAVLDARNLVVTFTPLGPKAAEGCRSPRRFAPANHARKSARFWTAPVLWRFHCARAVRDARDLVVSFTPLEPKAAEDCRSPRRSAPADHARKSARFWTAPVLWRFDCARATDDARHLLLRLTPLEPKAAEDCRSPRRFAPANHARKSAGVRAVIAHHTATTSWNH